MRLIQYLMIGSLILPILVAEKIQTAGQDTDEVQAVEGTDPELLILIEARKSKNGFTWHYTIGRMNSIQFEVRRKDEVVWKGAKLAPPWPNVRNPEKSYFHFGLGNVSVPQVREEGTSNENRVSEPTEN